MTQIKETNICLDRTKYSEEYTFKQKVVSLERICIRELSND